MKKNLLLALLLFVAKSSFAVEVEIDGLWYDVVAKTKEAKVIQYKNDVKYSGNIVIPESIKYEGYNYNVKTIGRSAFQGCSGLTSITIPSTVTNIESAAFSTCTGLTTIKIPNSVTTIGDYAIAYCSGLKSVIIGNGVTSIERQAFESCFNLTSVHITDLEAWCNINFSSNPLAFAKHLFLNDEEIIDLVIPNSVTIINDYAFEGSSITSVTIPNSVTTIGWAAFARCTGLTSVTIPNSVTNLGGDAFSECTSLTSVSIPNSITKIGNYTFMRCTSLTSIDIPNSVTSIEWDAFDGCTGLTEINIPNSVKFIGGYAFAGCSALTTIVIGSCVETIGGKAFCNCPELAEVYCYAENVPSMRGDEYSLYTPTTNAFEGSYIEYATLHVPSSSVNTYKATEPWKSFKSIVAIDGDTPQEKKCAKPNISYTHGKLKFDCETEGVEFVSEITDKDIKKDYTSEIELTVTYNISVYATKNGYDKSDTATATLCWIDFEPKTEGITNGIATVRAKAFIIQNTDGQLTVNGLDDGTSVYVYSLNGTIVGSAISHNGSAIINSNLQVGSAAIVKVGDKCIKVVLR